MEQVLGYLPPNQGHPPRAFVAYWRALVQDGDYLKAPGGDDDDDDDDDGTWIKSDQNPSEYQQIAVTQQPSAIC